MNKIYKTLYLKALMLVMITGLFAFSANGQTIDTFDPDSIPDPALRHFIGGQDTVGIDTIGVFSGSTMFYLHYDFPIDEDKILAQSADTSILFNWEYLNGALEDYWVTAAVDLGVNQQLDFDPADIDLGGTQDFVMGGDFYTNEYQMDEVGFRRLTTPEVPELNTNEDASLFIDMFLGDVVGVEDSLLVEYSTNGTDWIILEDLLDSAYFNNLYADENLDDGFVNLEFELPANAKTATTQFRIRQGERSDYVLNEDEWAVDADNFRVEISGENIITSQFVGNYSVERPTTSIADITDEDGATNFTYYPGDSINVEANFVGFENQVNDYDFTVVFDWDGNSFRLEDEEISNILSTDNMDGSFTYEFTVSGFLPVDVEFDESWDVTIVAFNGATPTISSSLDLTGDAVSVGFSGGSFSDDDERSLTSPELNIESVSNAVLFVDLVKESSGLSPAGTEIVIEYSTDGFATSAQIGDAISLNADLSERDTIDVSTLAALVSSTTQFRLRQLSNNGEDLDTWDVDEFMFFATGTLVEDEDPIDYTSSSIDIDAPIIVLDAVDVPEDLIFPGDEVDLTYNIIEGEFVAGTMFSAILEGGTFDYIIGTSDLIAPGDDQDHTITVTIPPVVGGDYSVKLMTNPESNSVTIPIFNTTLEITEVTSDNGITDGDVDVFYPGDNITANYTIDGSVGAGAELIFEVWDQGDPATTEDDVWVILSSATDADIDGDITGTLPTDINFDDPSNPKVRIRIGNGQLANMSGVLAEDLEGNGVGNFFISTNPADNGYLFDMFDEELIQGNDPTDINHLIGSGERSATTIPFEMPFGGGVYIELNGISYDFDQDIYVQASNDEGANWETLEMLEYTGTGFLASEFFLDIPLTLWGDQVRFRVIYNEAGDAEEFENEIELDYLYVIVNESVSANSDEFDISGQLRRYTISLEEINDPVTYIVGEEVTIEYTTEGPFPATTGFALIFEGDLDAGDGATGGYDDGEDFLTVVATSTDQGSGSFTFNVPDMAYEFDGTDTNFDLYDFLTVVAYDATGGADFLPNETIVIDSDSQFLVIEGTDEEDGNYTFDLAGDRSALTQAFDLSGAQAAYLNFNYTSSIDADDNILTIPVLQYSIDAGASFDEIDIEDSDLAGGYIVGTMGYSVMVPNEAITSATHFRWVQDLNLGADEDTWTINGISIELVNGNEITTDYNVVNDNQIISVAHPSTADYELTQVDPDDAIFNGETADLSFDPIFETFDAFPANTAFEYLLYDVAEGEYVVDPETNDPLRVGTATGPGAFTATIPFYVENGTYEVRLIAEKTGGEDVYFYVGSEDDGISIGTIEVFLRVLKTTFVFDDADVFYAGNTATFNFDIENDETNLDGTDGLFLNLLVKDFDNGDDLLIYTQEGFTETIDVALLPFLRQSYRFEAQLSQGSALGEVGDIIGQSDLLALQNDSDNFINYESSETFATRTYTEEELGFNTNEAIFYTLDYTTSGGNLRLQYSLDGGEFVNFINHGNGNQGSTFWGWTLPSEVRDQVGNNTIAFRWIVEGTQGSLDVSGVFFRDVVVDDSELIDFSELVFENQLGRGLITTRDFEVGELDNSELISLDLTFGKSFEEILASNVLIFEYSIDGGATFSEISTFPEEDGDALVNENFLFDVTDDMKMNPVSFRFRQEERNNILVVIEDLSILSGRTLPFDYVEDEQAIVPQTLLVTGLSNEFGCLEDQIGISYELRGRFGQDNVVTVSYEQIGGTATGTLDNEFSVVGDNTTNIAIQLPADVFTNGESNKSFRFRLNYNDDTYIDDMLDFASTGEPLSETNIEVIAPVDIDASGSISSGLTVCDGDELIFTLSNPQDYFSYEVINLADGSVASGATPFVFDPELGEVDIPLTGITEDTEVQLRVTPSSSLGTSTNCSSAITSTQTVDVLFNQDLIMFFEDQGSGAYNVAEAAGASTLNICEGGDFSLAVNRDIDDAGSGVGGVTIEWFRDDEDNPIGVSDAVFNNADSYVPVTGSYFARITDGACVYTTEAVQINVAVQPAQPAITVVSGNLEGCETEADVTLEAPAGFAFYQWSAPGGYDGSRTSRTIVTDVAGTYTVQVSDNPFTISGQCESESSEPVIIERYESPNELGISTTSSFGANEIVDGSTQQDCESFDVYFFDVDETGSGSAQTTGTIEIIRDGVSDGFQEMGPSGGNVVTLTESGTYSFNWINDDALDDVTACGATSVSFTLTIVETPNAVEITSTGDLAFCEGEGSVTLTAPAGFAQYRWFVNGSEITATSDGFDTNNNVIMVTSAGVYTVEVSNFAGEETCFSSASNGIEVFVRNRPTWNSTWNTINDQCGPGTVTFEVFNTNQSYVYQLIDLNSGLPSGAAVRGSSNEIFLESDVISETTSFEMSVAYADGLGCTEFTNSVRTATVNNFELVLEGNQLVTNISGSYNSSSSDGYPRWYRVTTNGNVELRNKRGEESFTLIDGSEYIAEVVFDEGCEITASSASLVDPAARIEPVAAFDVIASPNPVVNAMTVNVSGGVAGSVSISIVDLSGRVEVSMDFEKSAEDLNESFSLDALGIDNGIYNLVIRQGGKVESVRIVKQ